MLFLVCIIRSISIICLANNMALILSKVCDPDKCPGCNEIFPICRCGECYWDYIESKEDKEDDVED
jgi:hypothetical protein